MLMTYERMTQLLQARDFLGLNHELNAHPERFPSWAFAAPVVRPYRAGEFEWHEMARENWRALRQFREAHG